jgi:hypothetical protein
MSFNFLVQNNVRTTLADTLNDSDTQLTINYVSPPFSDIPELDSENEVRITIIDDLANPTKVEIVRLDDVIEDTGSTRTYEITREQEDTIAETFEEGSTLFLALTADMIRALADSGENGDVDVPVAILGSPEMGFLQYQGWEADENFFEAEDVGPWIDLLNMTYLPDDSRDDLMEKYKNAFIVDYRINQGEGYNYYSGIRNAETSFDKRFVAFTAWTVVFIFDTETGTFRYLNPDRYDENTEFTMWNGSRGFTFSPDNEIIAGTVDPWDDGARGLWVLNMSDFSQITDGDIPNISASGRGISFTPNGEYLIISSRLREQELIVLETENWTQLSNMPVIDGNGVSIAVSPDSNYVAIGADGDEEEQEQNLTIIDINTWEVVPNTFDVVGRPYDMKFSPDGTYLAVISWPHAEYEDMYLHIIETENWTQIDSFFFDPYVYADPSDPEYINDVFWFAPRRLDIHPDNKHILITGDWTEWVAIYNLQTQSINFQPWGYSNVRDLENIEQNDGWSSREDIGTANFLNDGKLFLGTSEIATTVHSEYFTHLNFKGKFISENTKDLPVSKPLVLAPTGSSEVLITNKDGQWENRSISSKLGETHESFLTNTGDGRDNIKDNNWNDVIFNKIDEAEFPNVPVAHTDIAVSSDGEYFAVARGQNGVQIRVFQRRANTNSWEHIETFSVGGTLYGLKFFPDDSKLAVAHTTGNRLTVYDTDTWESISGIPSIPGTGRVRFDISPDGAYLATGHLTGDRLTIYDTSDWSIVSGTASIPDEGASDFITDLKYADNGNKLIVTKRRYQNLIVYDTNTWDQIEFDDDIHLNLYTSLAYMNFIAVSDVDDSIVAICPENLTTPIILDLYDTSGAKHLDLRKEFNADGVNQVFFHGKLFLEGRGFPYLQGHKSIDIDTEEMLYGYPTTPTDAETYIGRSYDSNFSGDRSIFVAGWRNSANNVLKIEVYDTTKSGLNLEGSLSLKGEVVHDGERVYQKGTHKTPFLTKDEKFVDLSEIYGSGILVRSPDGQTVRIIGIDDNGDLEVRELD